MREKTRQSKSVTRPAAVSADPAEASYPISTRLSEAQKRWVDEAAGIKGWTPANFIRQAAVGKAVHTVNTSRANKFDFDSLAAGLAKQLCKPEIHIADLENDPSGNTEVYEDQLPRYDLTTDSLSPGMLSLFREAVRLGGSEFIATVLDRCTRILEPPSRAGLPDPIQPE